MIGLPHPMFMAASGTPGALAEGLQASTCNVLGVMLG